MNFNNKQVKSFIKILKEKLTLTSEILTDHSASVILAQNQLLHVIMKLTNEVMNLYIVCEMMQLLKIEDTAESCIKIQK